MIHYLSLHYMAILQILLLISEAAAAITQLIAPTNVGFSGFLAGLIKMLQKVVT